MAGRYYWGWPMLPPEMQEICRLFMTQRGSARLVFTLTCRAERALLPLKYETILKWLVMENAEENTHVFRSIASPRSYLSDRGRGYFICLALQWRPPSQTRTDFLNMLARGRWLVQFCHRSQPRFERDVLGTAPEPEPERRLLGTCCLHDCCHKPLLYRCDFPHCRQSMCEYRDLECATGAIGCLIRNRCPEHINASGQASGWSPCRRCKAPLCAVCCHTLCPKC